MIQNSDHILMVFCLHGFASYFTCGSGDIWTKLLSDKVKNNVIPCFFCEKRASYVTKTIKNMIICITFIIYDDLAQKLPEKKAMYQKNCSSKYNHICQDLKVNQKIQVRQQILNKHPDHQFLLGILPKHASCAMQKMTVSRYTNIVPGHETTEIAHEMFDKKCWKKTVWRK